MTGRQVDIDPSTGKVTADGDGGYSVEMPKAEGVVKRERRKPPIISPRRLQLRPPELGKIKIGGLGPTRRSGQGKEFRIPEKYDHFEITGRDRTPAGDLIRDDFCHRPVEQGGVGPEPKELPIRLYFDDPWDNFQSEFTQYDGKTRLCACDGEVCTQYARKTQDGAVKLDEPKVFPCKMDDGCACKPMGRLSVYLEASGHFGGFHVFRTTSWETIRNIQTALTQLHGLFGHLAGVPLLLKMYAAEVQYPGQGGKMQRGRAWKVALVMRGTFEDVYARAAEAFQHRLAGAEQLKLLASAHREHLDAIESGEEPDIAAEWFPDEGAVIEADMAEKAEDQVGALKERLAGAKDQGPPAPAPQDDGGANDPAPDPESARDPEGPQAAEEGPPLMDGVDTDGVWVTENVPKGYAIWLTGDGHLAFWLDGLEAPREAPPLAGFRLLSTHGPVAESTARSHIQNDLTDREAEAQGGLL